MRKRRVEKHNGEDPERKFPLATRGEDLAKNRTKAEEASVKCEGVPHEA